jgi:hypothetical protein
MWFRSRQDRGIRGRCGPCGTLPWRRSPAPATVQQMPAGPVSVRRRQTNMCGLSDSLLQGGSPRADPPGDALRRPADALAAPDVGHPASAGRSPVRGCAAREEFHRGRIGPGFRESCCQPNGVVLFCRPRVKPPRRATLPSKPMHRKP